MSAQLAYIYGFSGLLSVRTVSKISRILLFLHFQYAKIELKLSDVNSHAQSIPDHPNPAV